MSCICFSILDKDFSSSGGLGRRRSKAIFLNINIADIGVTIFPMAGEPVVMKIHFALFSLLEKEIPKRQKAAEKKKIFVVFVIWLKRNMILSSSNLWNRCFVAHDVTLKKWVSFFALPETIAAASSLLCALSLPSDNVPHSPTTWKQREETNLNNQ